MDGISFYPETESNHKFLQELMAILNREDSSIADCYIGMSTSNMFTVFIETKNPQYSFSSITFNFSHGFNRYAEEEGEDSFYNYYKKEGLSKMDTDSLNELFNRYTFSNYYEALFFGSKFFTEKRKQAIIYLKYDENEKQNRHLIDNIKVALFYKIISKDDLKHYLERTKYLEGTSLIECNTTGLSSNKSKAESITEFHKMDDEKKKNYVLVEHAKNYENLQGYIVNIHELVNNELIPLDIIELKKINKVKNNKI